MKEWSFINNHGLVLLYVSQNPQCTTREMAAALNVTERTIHRILGDLAAGGYITWQRTSKSNFYEINSKRKLKHELTRDTRLGDLLKLLSSHKRGNRQG